ncbi:recombinase family protein [Sphingomonas aerophila]|uniref:DNA invertase Pin-like site-specific DNA recombinase n=1 Tax=Sphingomonas aerophila TaxID=1344948 RepID=A0A7W9EWM1_9SPHN|nr:recombinase family protein [Sphingomonas aerophila]MBB5715867.1 DNA invertase Pin-like site-specific DNA recombinase [Sphingomonas aerophila]
MGKALIYIRFSTRVQERGDSRRRQLEDCEDYCRKRNLEVEEVIEDLGRSAYKGEHLSMGNLGKLTQRIVRGEIEPGTTLVVEKLDRLSRQKPRIIRRWIEDACDRGLRIARVTGGPVIDATYLDDGANMAAMIEMAYQSNAGHEYSQNISQRLTSAWKEKRKRTGEGKGLLTASAPRWLTTTGDWEGKNATDRRSWTIIPERGATVVKVYELAADGVGTWGIAKYLNENGVAPWGKRSESSTREGWNHTSVLNVLQSPAVEGLHFPTSTASGKRERTGEVYRDYYPIIEGMNADLIARARAQLQKRAGGGPKSNVGKNLLASLARCGSCGGFMILRNRSGKEAAYAYLQCDNASKSKGCEAKGMFNYRLLEPAILDAVLHHTLDNSFFSAADKTAELRIALAEQEKRLGDRREERDNTRALLRRFPGDDQLAGDWQRLSEDVRALEQERVSLSAALAEASGAISDVEHLRKVHNFRQALDDEDEEVRRTARLRVRDAFRAVITHLVCKQDGEEKLVQLALANGLVTCVFDNKGKLLPYSQNFTTSDDHVHGLTSGVMSDNAPLVDSVLRRTAQRTSVRAT